MLFTTLSTLCSIWRQSIKSRAKVANNFSKMLSGVSQEDFWDGSKKLLLLLSLLLKPEQRPSSSELLASPIQYFVPPENTFFLRFSGAKSSKMHKDKKCFHGGLHFTHRHFYITGIWYRSLASLAERTMLLGSRWVWDLKSASTNLKGQTVRRRSAVISLMFLPRMQHSLHLLAT